MRTNCLSFQIHLTLIYSTWLVVRLRTNDNKYKPILNNVLVLWVEGFIPRDKFPHEIVLPTRLKAS